MTQQNLLVELLVEELPPKALKKLGDAFAQSLLQELANCSLIENTPSGQHFTAYSTPRRLAESDTDVKAQAPDQPLEQKLMPVSVGLTADGQATPALIKKLNALGVDTAQVQHVLKQLHRVSDGKTEVLYHHRMVKGMNLQMGLQSALEHALAQLPIPKTMQYQLHQHCDQPGWSTVSFVRPAHGLVALHGNDVVHISVLGLAAGNTTRGHRFEARCDPVTIGHADAYEATLAEQGAVIASFERRSAVMLQALRDAAHRLNARLEIETPDAAPDDLMNHALVQEVTALVEHPNVLVCQFEETFLQVPKECLILTMKANQKYFPLINSEGELSHRFLVVSNIHPTNPQAITEGNERVVRPRLADAKFFYDQDRKKTLESRVAGLDKVVYHHQLGTQGDRMQRVCAVAQSLAHMLLSAGWVPDPNCPGDVVTLSVRAARLAKTDLLTDMVGEFPELQGIMGRYYALNDQEDAWVAQAVSDHYRPRFAGDALPSNDVGLVVALADKLETLVGMFAIGNFPTGDKDPFALRRHALGVTRMLIDKALPLGLAKLIQMAVAVFPSDKVGRFDHEKLKLFFQERLMGLLESEGHPNSHVMSVLSVETPDGWRHIRPRLAAVSHFAGLPESQALAAANKRISNILKKIDQPFAEQVDPACFSEAAEQQLHQCMLEVAPQANAKFEAGDYTGQLIVLAGLREPVDRFFSDVMVNAEDPKTRHNRWALLKQLHTHMNRVADLSRLV